MPPCCLPVLRHGTVPEALKADDVPAAMKSILRFLQTVQGQVPCTDAARRTMRHQLTSLTTYFGFPLLFVTLNPADVLHPFTWRHALDTGPQLLHAADLDKHLLDALRSIQLWHVVAEDPTAAVEAFHLHVETFLQQLLDVPTSSTKLASDGIASASARGIFGPLTAAFGSIEPQQRGSLHIHFLLFCYGFQDPRSLLHRFKQQLPLLEAQLWKWIQSIVVTAFEAIPSVLKLPDSSLSNLRPLPYSNANLHVLHQAYAQHVQTSTDHWFSADPSRFLLATDFLEMPFPLDVPKEKPFLPWCLDYVTSLSDPLPWARCCCLTCEPLSFIRACCILARPAPATKENLAAGVTAALASGTGCQSGQACGNALPRNRTCPKTPSRTRPAAYRCIPH